MSKQPHATPAIRRYFFVGQRPSHRAEQIGATWANGKLAACTLWRALEALGIDPRQQVFINIWETAEPVSPEREAEAEERAFAAIRTALADGLPIIGMGAVVHRWLLQRGVAFTKMVHPAARGALRRRERYQRHVAEVLTGVTQ